MIRTELYILDMVLIGVLAYSALRVDRMDGPLALCRSFVLFFDFCMLGLRELWFKFAASGRIYLKFGCTWIIDVLFLASFATMWCTSYRYYRGRWPARMHLWIAGLVVLILVVDLIHKVQRIYMGLGPWDAGVRWVVINGICLTSVVMAGWYLARVLRREAVYLAHLVHCFFIVISIVQFLMALKPGAWNMELSRLGNLLFSVVSLSAYGARLVYQAVRGRRSPNDRTAS